jgi:RES domain-containing protein
MEVFRISSEKYSHVLTASGTENRWNKFGEFVIYAGSSRSLATLELVVHKSAIAPTMNYKVLIIHIPDDTSLIEQIQVSDLSKNWRSKTAYPELQTIGSNWYNKQQSLILKVPSAVIPLEFNYIINTKHLIFDRIGISEVEDYFWDSRLF